MIIIIMIIIIIIIVIIIKIMTIIIIITTRSTWRVQTFARAQVSSPGNVGSYSKKSTVIGSHISSIKTRKLIWAGASNAGAWQGLCSTDDFQIVMETSLSQFTSLEKNSENMIISFRLVGCTIVGVWRRYALHG